MTKLTTDALEVLRAVRDLPKRHTAIDIWKRTGLSLNRIGFARKQLLRIKAIIRDRKGSRVHAYYLTVKGLELLLELEDA